MGLQNTLKALADPIRREILNLLKNGPLSAGEIVDHFSVTGASISRHLSVLKEADLIRDRREGKFIYAIGGLVRKGEGMLVSGHTQIALKVEVLI